jgi:hypothetical protein
MSNWCNTLAALPQQMINENYVANNFKIIAGILIVAL